MNPFEKKKHSECLRGTKARMRFSMKLRMLNAFFVVFLVFWGFFAFSSSNWELHLIEIRWSNVGIRNSEAILLSFSRCILCDWPWSCGLAVHLGFLCCQNPHLADRLSPVWDGPNSLLLFSQVFLTPLFHGETKLKQLYSLWLSVMFLMKWRSEG